MRIACEVQTILSLARCSHPTALLSMPAHLSGEDSQPHRRGVLCHEGHPCLKQQAHRNMHAGKSIPVSSLMRVSSAMVLWSAIRSH